MLCKTFIENKCTEIDPLSWGLVIDFPVWAIKREINKVNFVWHRNKIILSKGFYNLCITFVLEDRLKYLWF